MPHKKSPARRVRRIFLWGRKEKSETLICIHSPPLLPQLCVVLPGSTAKNFSLRFPKKPINSNRLLKVLPNWHLFSMAGFISGRIIQNGVVFPKRPYKRAKQALLCAHITRFGVSYGSFCKFLSVSLLESQIMSSQLLHHKLCKFDSFSVVARLTTRTRNFQ